MDDSKVVKHKNILYAALGDLVRLRLRSWVSLLCLTAILFPLVTGLAISEGLRFQAEIALREGADLYVSEDLCGGDGPVSLTSLDDLTSKAGISHGAARVVGRTYFVERLVAVVGLEEKGLLALKPLVRGEIPRSRGDVVVGESIARAFGIKPGPGMRFTLSANNRKFFVPTGTLVPSCLWSSEILIMRIEDANEFFRMQGRASHHLLYGSENALSGAFEGKTQPLFRLGERPAFEKRLAAGYGHGGGVFVVLFLIGAALILPALVVTSGLGLKEVDKEIGILMATGWSTWDVLEKSIMEGVMIGLMAASLSILLSMAWIKGFNGALIAWFYISEIGLFPEPEVPSRYLPSHALFCLASCLAVTLAGGLWGTWRKTRPDPGELMRR